MTPSTTIPFIMPSTIPANHAPLKRRPTKKFRSNQGETILGRLTGTPQNSANFRCNKQKAFDTMILKFFSLDDHIQNLTILDGKRLWELSDDSWNQIKSGNFLNITSQTRHILNLILLKSTYKSDWKQILQWHKSQSNREIDISHSAMMKFIGSAEDHALKIKDIITKHQPDLANLKLSDEAYHQKLMLKIKHILQQENMLHLISKQVSQIHWKIITKIINQKTTMVIGLERFNGFLSLINDLYTSENASFAMNEDNQDSYDIFYYLLGADFFFPALEKLAELRRGKHAENNSDQLNINESARQLNLPNQFLPLESGPLTASQQPAEGFNEGFDPDVPFDFNPLQNAANFSDLLAGLPIPSELNMIDLDMDPENPENIIHPE